MFNLSGFVVWVCKRFNREQITQIVKELERVLKDPHSELQPKNTFKEDNPEYRKFDVDPKPPLREPAKKKSKRTTKRY